MAAKKSGRAAVEAEVDKLVTAAPSLAKKETQEKEAAPERSCFVMMPFREPFYFYYDKVYKPAIEAAGFTATRADDLFRSTDIVDDMWQDIQAAEVLLADMTEANANVFYELGLAHAKGKPVVLLARKEDDVPFDLRHYRTHFYDPGQDRWYNMLQDNITAAIKEVADAPIKAVPKAFRKLVESDAPEQDETNARLEELERRWHAYDRGADSAADSVDIAPPPFGDMLPDGIEAFLTSLLERSNSNVQFRSAVKVAKTLGLGREAAEKLGRRVVRGGFQKSILLATLDAEYR